MLADGSRLFYGDRQEESAIGWLTVTRSFLTLRRNFRSSPDAAMHLRKAAPRLRVLARSSESFGVSASRKKRDGAKTGQKRGRDVRACVRASSRAASAPPLAFGDVSGVLGCPGPFTLAVSREIKARPPRLAAARLTASRFEPRRAARIVLNRGRIVSPLSLRSVALLSRSENSPLSRPPTTSNGARREPFFGLTVTRERCRASGQSVRPERTNASNARPALDGPRMIGARREANGRESEKLSVNFPPTPRDSASRNVRSRSLRKKFLSWSSSSRAI